MSTVCVCNVKCHTSAITAQMFALSEYILLN